MRKLAFVMAGLLALALLAGCTEAPAETVAPGPTADDPGRTARGSPGEGDEDDEGPELQPVELLRAPLTMAGQGPESFDLTVPDGIVRVDFRFTGGQSFQQSGLSLELTGCGTFETGGVGVSGSTGSADYSDKLCSDATAGPATVTISATLLVFDGTFLLTGFTEVGNSTAPAA